MMTPPNQTCEYVTQPATLESRLQPYLAELSKLAGQARRRKGGRLWFAQQAEALLVPAVVAPWELDEAETLLVREFWEVDGEA